MNPSFKTCAIRLVVTTIALITVSPATTRWVQAQSDPGMVLPSTKISVSLPAAMDKAKGFTVDILSDGAGGVGYLPVLISIKSTGAFAGDRNFVIRFEPVELGYSPPRSGISCDVPITVTQVPDRTKSCAVCQSGPSAVGTRSGSSRMVSNLKTIRAKSAN